MNYKFIDKKNRFSQGALRIALCAIISLFVVSMEAHGQETTSELVAKVQRQYDQTRSIRADFSQVTRSRAASLGTTAKGKLYFLRCWNAYV